MKVKCICKEFDDSKLLTLNKVYDVLDVVESLSGKVFYYITDDQGMYGNYYSHKFEIVKEEKEMKVKCVDSSYTSYRLTTGSDYKVLSESKLFGDSYYQVICDDNRVREFLANRFEIVKEENEMKEFLNENKRKFKDLTDEEKLLIINEKMKGNVEYIIGSIWEKASDWEINFKYVYRTKPKPAKKLDIPWQFIKPEFKWAAMDNDGEVYLFVEKPECKDDYFYSIHYMSLVDIINIDTTGVDWKTSLTQRPEGV